MSSTIRHRALRERTTLFRLRALSAEGRLRAAARSIGALAATVGVVTVVVVALGANPGTVFKELVVGALGSKFTFGETVMIAALLSLTALAAAIPFSARLWNVGGEGQLYFGAFVAAGLSLSLPTNIPHGLFAPLVVVVAGLGGAVWALVPGVLKATINANEVIVSLMMTFIAVLLADYAITVVWPQGAAPQTANVPANATLPNIWPGTLITAGAPLAVFATVCAWLIMFRTALGFEIRAIGSNVHVCRLSGVRIRRVTILSFALGGTFAGLAGAVAVLGMNNALVSNFSENFGFLGIAVALVARLSPAWTLPSAFFFAILRVGSDSLQAASGLSPTVGEVLAATFIILLLAFRVIRLRYAEAVE
jgi:simple sugar transport system permease protein